MNRNAVMAIAAQYSTGNAAGTDVISWNNGMHCVIPSVRFGGKCVQAHYEGRNLMPDNPTPVSQPSYYGYTVSYDAHEQEWTVDGTLRNPGNIILDNDLNPDWTVGETYTLKLYHTGGSFTLGEGTGITMGLAIFNKNSSQMIRTPINGTNIHNLTATGAAPAEAGGSGYSLLFQCWRVGTVFDQAKFKVQLERGTAATAYEPYCGGMPSPTPLWPQPIHPNDGVYACGDRQVDLSAVGGLYAVEGYRDEWDSQSGRGIRRCGVIDAYAGEAIATPWLSSTGSLSPGATVVYGIPDTPFTATAQKLIQPAGAGELLRVSGGVPDAPVEVRYGRYARA